MSSTSRYNKKYCGVNSDESIVEIGKLAKAWQDEQRSKDITNLVESILSEIRDESRMHILVEIVQDKSLGYRGAIYSLLHLGSLGVQAVFTMGEIDRSGRVYGAFEKQVYRVDEEEILASIIEQAVYFEDPKLDGILAAAGM